MKMTDCQHSTYMHANFLNYTDISTGITYIANPLIIFSLKKGMLLLLSKDSFLKHIKF